MNSGIEMMKVLQSEWNLDGITGIKTATLI